MSEGRPVAVVTGGTHGIGRHAAETLAAAGWSVAVCSRREDEARQVARELERDHGASALGAGADVRRPDELERFAIDVTDGLGPPLAVLANAGVLGPVGPLHTVDLAAWASAVEIDLIGVANTLAVFGSGLAARGRGSMVTLSGGGVGGPNMASALSAYTSSKAAVVALTETVARELAPHGVRVNAIAPGAIRTRFMDPVIEAGPDVAGTALYEQAQRQRDRPDSLGDFDEILRLLFDPDGPFVTGRLLSARWDDPSTVTATAGQGGRSMYQLRRIDGVLFGEMASGR